MVRRAVVLGGAGFIGSHVTEALLAAGWDAVVVDSGISGSVANLTGLDDAGNLQLIHADITEGIEVDGPVDLVMHLASPASPIDYQRFPIETLRVGSHGTENALRFALDKGARLVFASTSEVYGDPLVHPQPETYWGNVNPIGPRSMYDEAKRFSEALVFAYQREHGASVGVARIFNTYGPRMRVDDGRAIPEFFRAAIEKRPLPIHGSGEQTRSLCFVSDLVRGLTTLAASEESGPINLGNPHEVTIAELAELVQDVVGNHPGTINVDRPEDDPSRRRPDITLARERLGWEPIVSILDGLSMTRDWFVERVEVAP